MFKVRDKVKNVPGRSDSELENGQAQHQLSLLLNGYHTASPFLKRVQRAGSMGQVEGVLRFI